MASLFGPALMFNPPGGPSTPARKDFNNMSPQRLHSTRYNGPIKRGGPPFLFIQPMTMSKRPRQSRRLVLTLPKDNIHILNAEAMPEKGQQFLPTTLTLSLRDNTDSEDNNKGNLRYSTTRSYASQIPSPPRQASRYHYGFVPVSQGDSDEEDRSSRKPGRWNKGEVSYEMDDLVGSSGGHVTVIKAHSGRQPKVLTARKVMSGGSSFKPMKAILIEPKEIEAKRVHVMEADSEKVTATKARVIAAPDSVATGYKAKVHPVSYKKGIVTKTKGEDWAASNLHFVKTEAPQDSSARHQDEDVPPMELQCGGTNDLGWCDLGPNYPSAEVSQIMEVCEELVNHMFIEVPENSGPMEDIATYSLSRNITNQGSKPYWPWKTHSTNYKRSLCEINREVIRPSFAQDMKGKWHVIIQTDAFPQRIALEVCKKPGEPCNSNDLCSKSKSQCVQKYSHHQLISFDPESAETCPYIRLYKFPTSCVCRLA
ncbi:spaetzle domain-containing protein [Caerostris extrusa]|uniref:Spaetzle domain-containing protein n=1 Tax=Caerostris extrusa TaxID=172846 RepID=A0AAV4MLI5_CAEEX|nr:spaetzle domain-containing protein [Caerostris extrusa]